MSSGRDQGERDESRRPEAGGRDRLAWERPRVLLREPLEAVAVACVPTVQEGGPGKPDTIQCVSPSS